MGEAEYWQWLQQRRLRRRALLRAGGVAGAALGLSAISCGGSSKTAAPNLAATGAAKAGGTAQPVQGGILSQRLQTDPATLDIHQSSTYGAVWPEAPAYNQLVQFDPQDPDNKIIPDLAASYEVAPDGLSVVFKLHPSVKFHDGSDFTSEDVKANIDWIKSPPAKKPSPRAGVLATIDHVETADPLTAKFVLTRPTPSLFANLATEYLAIGAKGDLAKGDLGTQLNGTGPFRLKNYTRGVGLELERNPDYFIKGRPYLDGLKFAIVPDGNTAFTDFLSGQFQIYYPVVAENVPRVSKETGGKAKVSSKPGLVGDNLFFSGAKKPFDDPRVRQAVSLALDRQGVVQTVEGGLAVAPAAYLKPNGLWSAPADQLRKVPGYDKPDIAAAKKLLQEAGISQPLSGTILTRGDQEFRDLATFVQASLQKAFGWNYQIDAKDSAAAYDAAYAGRFDLCAWLIGLTVDDPDASFAEIAITKAVRNWSKVFDPEADVLYDKQSQTLDVAQRKPLVQQLQLKFMNDYQIVGLAARNNVIGIWNTVQGYQPAASLYVNQRFQDIWLSKS